LTENISPALDSSAGLFAGLADPLLQKGAVTLM